MRDLKTGGKASKEEITAEVTTLINLKAQLAAAQGVEASATGDKKNKKGGAAGAGGKENVKQSSASAQSSTPADEAEVSRLQALVSQQVRLL